MFHTRCPPMHSLFSSLQSIRNTISSNTICFYSSPAYISLHVKWSGEANITSQTVRVSMEMIYSLMPTCTRNVSYSLLSFISDIFHPLYQTSLSLFGFIYHFQLHSLRRNIDIHGVFNNTINFILLFGILYK